MKKLIICCLLIVLWMGLLSCTLIASAASNEETANLCTSPAEFRIDWTIKNEGKDSTGFAFEIKIYSRPKYCELDSDGNVESSKYISYDTDSKFMLNEAKTNLHCYGSNVFIDIHGNNQNLSEYPDVPNQSETVLSRIMNKKTRNEELAKLNAMAVGVKDMADAEQLMAELIEYLSTPCAVPQPQEEPAPRWPIIAAIGGGVAVVAAVPVSLLVIKRKRRKEAV